MSIKVSFKVPLARDSTRRREKGMVGVDEGGGGRRGERREGERGRRTHHVKSLVDPVGTALGGAEAKLEALEAPVRDTGAEAFGPRAGRRADLGDEVSDRPERLHDDARAMREVRVADRAAEEGAARALGEGVGLCRVHLRRGGRGERGDDDGGGVDVAAESPLRRVREEVRAGFEVEGQGDEGARRVEDPDGVGLERRRGRGCGAGGGIMLLL